MGFSLQPESGTASPSTEAREVGVVSEVLEDFTFKGTIWENPQQLQGRRWSLSWAEMKERVANPPDLKLLKVQRALWTLATFQNDRRKLNEFESASGLLLAYEPRGDLGLEVLHRVWGDWAHLVYRVSSALPEEDRWIVILPLAHPVDAPSYRRLMEWAASRLGGLDPACKQPGRAYPLPARTPESAWGVVEDRPVLDPDRLQGEDLGSSLEAAALSRFPQVASLFAQGLGRWEDRARGRHRPVVPPWRGVAELLGGGLWEGLHLLTGPSGVGRTQFCLQWALHAARQGLPTLYANPVEDGPTLGLRLAALLLGRPLCAISAGELPVDDAARGLVAGVRGLPFRAAVSGSLSWDPGQIESLLRGFRKQHPQHLLFVVLDLPSLVDLAESELPLRALETLLRVAQLHRAAVLLAVPSVEPGLESLVEHHLHLDVAEPGLLQDGDRLLATRQLSLAKSRSRPGPLHDGSLRLDFDGARFVAS